MKVVLPCLLAVSVIASCTSSKPATQYPGNISAYQNASVSWAPVNAGQQKIQPSIFFNETGDSLIRAEVNRQLALRGYKIDGEGAKLLVNYCTLEEEKLTTLDMTYKERYGKNGMYTNNYPDSSKQWLFMLQSKTLIIDLVDSKTNQLIWRGWSTGIESSAKKYDAELVRETVEEIFKQFPLSTK